MTTPIYYYKITNRHGISAADWTEDSQAQLRDIARQHGADLAWNGYIAVSTRAQLEAVASDVAQRGCTIGDYHEYADGDESLVLLESLERYGTHGWSYVVRWRNWNFASGQYDIRRATYRTGRDGDGLWISLPDGDWKQISGTCQYSLPTNEKAARKTIERGLYGR